MKRRKTSKLILRQSNGDPMTCYECHSPEVEFIVHHDYEEPFLDIEDKEKKAKAEARFKYMVTERFLCRRCWMVNWYNDPDKYDDEDGLAVFTSIYKKNRDKLVWKSVNDYT